MAVMHTTMIKASITAYSTAVGPSSFFRKRTTAWPNLRMPRPSEKNWVKKKSSTLRPLAGSPLPRGSRADLADPGAGVGEAVVGVGAQGGDQRDAHHQDQGQHDGVLDRRRPVLALQEVP